MLWALACPDAVRVDSSVSQALRPFRASQAGMWRNGDDRGLRFQRGCWLERGL